MTIHLIVLVLALVCFGLSATSSGAPHWQRLVSVGLAAMALAQLV